MAVEPCPLCTSIVGGHVCTLCGTYMPHEWPAHSRSSPRYVGTVPADLAAAYRLGGMLGAAQLVGTHTLRTSMGTVCTPAKYEGVRLRLGNWWRSAAAVQRYTPRDVEAARAALQGFG